MTITIDAVWNAGTLRPKQPVALPEGAEVRVSLEIPEVDAGDPLAAVIGIGDGPAAGDGAARHDDYVYRRPRQ